MVLPLVPAKPAGDAFSGTDDRPVQLDDKWYMACRGDYVIRLDGTTCLQLWRAAGVWRAPPCRWQPGCRPDSRAGQ